MVFQTVLLSVDGGVQTQTDQQLFGRVVAHLLLAVVDGGGLQHHGQVAAGRDRDLGAGDPDAQNIVVFGLKAGALVVLLGVPGLQLDHQVHRLGHLDRARAVHPGHVDDAHAPQLDEVTDVLGGGAHDLPVGDLAQLDANVGHQPVAPLDQPDDQVDLAASAVPYDKVGLAVHLHQNASAANP